MSMGAKAHIPAEECLSIYDFNSGGLLWLPLDTTNLYTIESPATRFLVSLCLYVRCKYTNSVISLVATSPLDVPLRGYCSLHASAADHELFNPLYVSIRTNEVAFFESAFRVTIYVYLGINRRCTGETYDHRHSCCINVRRSPQHVHCSSCTVGPISVRLLLGEERG